MRESIPSLERSNGGGSQGDKTGLKLGDGKDGNNRW
jgi:hypothetical protein